MDYRTLMVFRFATTSLTEEQKFNGLARSHKEVT